MTKSAISLENISKFSITIIKMNLHYHQKSLSVELPKKMNKQELDGTISRENVWKCSLDTVLLGSKGTHKCPNICFFSQTITTRSLQILPGCNMANEKSIDKITCIYMYKGNIYRHSFSFRWFTYNKQGVTNLRHSSDKPTQIPRLSNTTCKSLARLHPYPQFISGFARSEHQISMVEKLPD